MRDIEIDKANLKLMYEHLVVALSRSEGPVSITPILKMYGFPSVYGTILGRLGIIKISKGKGVTKAVLDNLNDAEVLEVIKEVTKYNKTHQEKEGFNFGNQSGRTHLGHPNDDQGPIPPPSRYYDLDSSKERVMKKVSEAKDIITAQEKEKYIKELEKLDGKNIGAIYVPGMDTKTDSALKKIIEREAAIKITRRFRIKLFGFKVFEIES